jgi:hypothetical protein
VSLTRKRLLGEQDVDVVVRNHEEVWRMEAKLHAI